MIQDPEASLIPAQPIPAEAQEFTDRMQALLDGKPKDEVVVAKALTGMDDMLDVIASGLYNLASMLVGEGEDSIRLVEQAIASADVSICCNPVEARRVSRKLLSMGALELLAARDAATLAAPDSVFHIATCIEDDDLDSVGVSSEELENMIGGPDRERVRRWLAGLETRQRVVFTLRAVAGIPALDAAAMLERHGGPQAAGWTPDAVRELFRQALCSLASQLIHASGSR